jgi:hypothetical protein
MMAADGGATVIPVWNKSNREHAIVGSEPASVRAAADAAVKQLGWSLPYHVDADHINLNTVDRFIAASDFYTLDVASAIGQPAAPADVEGFLDRHSELTGRVSIPGIDEPFAITRDAARAIAGKYLFAVQQAGCIYRHVASARRRRLHHRSSMDETDAPQTPPELLVIWQPSPAKDSDPDHRPKFTGRFNKGVIAGDVAQFEKEFGDDPAMIAFATSFTNYRRT